MKKFLTLLVILLTSINLTFAKYFLVSIDLLTSDDVQKLLSLSLDFESATKIGNQVEIIVNEHELNEIQRNRLNFKVILQDYEKYLEQKILQTKTKIDRALPLGFQLGSMSGFYKLNEIYQQFDLIVSQYPEFFVKIDTIGWSWEGRPLIAYAFGNADVTIPEVLLTALHHAREPGTVTNLTYFLTKTLHQARIGNGEFRYLFKNFKIWIIPVLNPDGYYFNESQYPNGGGLWRKNRRKINDSTFGVDLNRNYGPFKFWDASNNGSSTNPKNETYRGPEPFSEPETQAIRNFALRHKFHLALNFHTYGGMIIYPFGATNQETPDSNFYRTFSNFVTNQIGYYFGSDLTTVGYPTRGNSDDWFYLSDSTKDKVIAFTVESGYQFDGFWPPINRIVEISEDNFKIIKETILSAEQNIKAEDLFYSFDTLRKIGLVNLKIVNIGTKDLNVPVKIQIQPLSDLISIDNPDTMISELQSTSAIYLSRRVNTPRKNFLNGTLVPFEISIIQNDLVCKDTFLCRLFDYKIKSLIESSNWLSDWWGYEIDSNSSLPVLCDSPYKNYADSIENIIVLRNPIDLKYSAVDLEIEATWKIEPFYDFCVIEISTDDGNNWESLRASRSMPASGNPYGKQKQGKFGYAGIYPFWVTQIFNLDKYLGKKILLRIALLSDKAKNFEGIAFRKFQLRVYDDIDFSVYSSAEIMSKKKTLIIESTIPAFISTKDVTFASNYLIVEIYDLLGNLINSKYLEENGGQFFYVIEEQIPKGIYILKMITNKNFQAIPILFF